MGGSIEPSNTPTQTCYPRISCSSRFSSSLSEAERILISPSKSTNRAKAIGPSGFVGPSAIVPSVGQYSSEISFCTGYQRWILWWCCTCFSEHYNAPWPCCQCGFSSRLVLMDHILRGGVTLACVGVWAKCCALVYLQQVIATPL